MQGIVRQTGFACWMGLALAALALGAPVAQVQDYEAIPYGDLEYMAPLADGAPARPVWARAGEPCAGAGWRVVHGQAAGGQVCIRGAAEGAEFVLGGEGAGGSIVGSVKLRADAPGARATVRLSWFNRLTRVDETKTFDLTTQWQSCQVKARADAGGPHELSVAPLGGTIYADDFSIRCPGPPGNEVVEDARELPRSPVWLSDLQQYKGTERGRSGVVELTFTFPAEGEPVVPWASGGIPFPKGELYDRRCLRVMRADGTPAPSQFDVLSRWQGDGSIQALLVTVPARREDGPVQRLRLAYSVEPPQEAALKRGPQAAGGASSPGYSRRAPYDVRALRTSMTQSPGVAADALGPHSPVFKTSDTIVLGLDGTELAQDGDVWVVTERMGPTTVVVSTRERRGPITVETRMTLSPESPRCLMRLCFVNEGPRCVIGGLGFRLYAPEGGFVALRNGQRKMALAGGERVAFGIGPSPSQAQSYGAPQGAEVRGEVLALSPRTALGVSVRDFAEKRPRGFTADKEQLTVWAWPPEAGPVVLSQGMACTLDLMLDLGRDIGGLDPNAIPLPPAYSTRALPLLTAPAEWYCNSGVFGFLMPPDRDSFPIFERTLGSLETLGSFSWAAKESRKLFGGFNFGDAPGDGGWANLETMADHEIFLHFFRTLSREHYESALLAAEHYRDVDVDHRFGFCHTHCNNHTSSGEGWSHAWIQGLRDAYFLTGDGRSLAVLREVGERLLSKEPGFATGRDWTRAIDDLVDIAQATGDARYIEAALKHCRVLGERQDPATGVCGAEKGSWYENRYEAGSAFTWYGCLAMSNLHQNVGGDELKRILLRELDLSLDVERKGKAAYAYLPDERISEDKRAEVIGIYALGRGSVLFPALGYAYRLTGDEKYLRLGMDVLAHCLLNQRGGSDASATSFITAFLREARAAGWGAKQEQEAFERARDFSWAQWPKELANGGFEMDSFRHWSVKKVPGQNAYTDPVVNVSYHLDEQVKLEGRRSLRIHSDNRTRVISVSTDVALPGEHRWRLTGWVRADETMNPRMSYSLRNYDTGRASSGSLSPTASARDGWREHAADFMTLGRMVLTVTVGNGSGTGDVRFDAMRLDDLGAVGKLLTDNGIGRAGYEPPPELVIPTHGTYLPDEPMTGDVKTADPIKFSEGALTDGHDGYDYHRTPCTYAYWEGHRQGEVVFDLGGEYRIRQVRLRVLLQESHGTARIELLPADSEVPIAVTEPPVNGWNTFDALDLTARGLRLRLALAQGKTYITVSEVEVWGERDW